MSEPGSQIDRLRAELATYRVRYPIAGELVPVDRLEQSVERRRGRRRTLEFELRHLHERLAGVEAQTRAVDAEIAGCERGLGLLIDDLLDRVRVRFGEAWSPAPVAGFRLWRVEASGLFGARERWQAARLAARCLAGGPAVDVPHAVETCGGSPPCGIYATKRLDELLAEHGVVPGVRVAMGAVALRGKVVEHERGYRAAAAEVEALALVTRTGMLLTSDRAWIEAVFEDWEGAMRRWGVRSESPFQSGVEFLSRHVERSAPWTLAAS
ncbi:MAG: hypothetical protein R6X29_08100 [Acidimicrobiia bacterium]